MSAVSPMPTFSLWSGGLLHRLFRPKRWGGGRPWDALTRSLVMVAIGWLPLCLIGAFEALRTHRWDPLLFQLEVHVRWLVAVPLLFEAEVLVDRRVAIAIRFLQESGLVPEHEQRAFERVQRSTLAQCDSVVEPALLVIAIVASVMSRDNVPGLLHWWHGVVSFALYRFLVLRWLQRWLSWASMLARVARLKLALIGTHPDRVGGLLVLEYPSRAFSLVILAFGSVLASGLTRRVLSGEHVVLDTATIVVYVAVCVALPLLPLLPFIPVLIGAKRKALYHFGVFARRYVQAFDDKWMGHSGEEALGSQDIQALADLGASYEVIGEMRPIPFSKELVLFAVLVSLVPLVPLYLGTVPLSTIASQLVKAIL